MILPYINAGKYRGKLEKSKHPTPTTCWRCPAVRVWKEGAAGVCRQDHTTDRTLPRKLHGRFPKAALLKYFLADE